MHIKKQRPNPEVTKPDPLNALAVPRNPVHKNYEQDRGTTTPVCQSRGTAPNVHAILQSRVNQDSPTTFRALRNSGRTSSTPGALPPRSFLTTSASLSPRDRRAHTRVPRPCFLTGRRVEVFLPPIHNVPSRGQQRTVSTIHSVDDALLPPPETPDGGPEPLRSRPEVVLHGLTELLPCLGFCLSNRHSCTPLGLPVPACCLRSPTGQKGPIGLLFQFDGIPHRRCPPAGSGIAATAGTDHLAATALVGRLNNGGAEHGPLGLQHTGTKPGGNKYCHPCPAPLTSGNSRVEESPTPLEKTGSRALAMRRGEYDYI
ncbi:hypothetical protein N1851_032948 [Merluccius polli]|uniref:Uncharacterized protein n=1 Tax=Merluccius polli TaxID=89951 RepID=A0AA47NPZ2_MERPO|nr:hypothetical protein N1851_032948 [Merluccius polli]